jgi:endonuclease YncB( thermonuclease family)
MAGVLFHNSHEARTRFEIAMGLAQQALDSAEQAADTAKELKDRLRAAQVAAGAIILKAHLTEIVDGDTITVSVGDHEYRIRLHGIDCPELDQPFGREAANAVGHLVDSDPMEIRLTGVDEKGQLIGVVSVDGKSVNLELVKAGLAWWHEQYAPDDKLLAERPNGLPLGW